MSIDTLDVGTSPDTSGSSRAPRARRIVAAAVIGGLAAAGGVTATIWNARENDAHTEALAEWRQARAALAIDLTEAERNAADLAATDVGAVEEAAEEDLQASGDGETDVDPFSAFELVVLEVRDLELDIDPTLSRAQDVIRAREVVETVRQARADLDAALLELRVAVASHSLGQAIDSLTGPAAELDAAVAAVQEAVAGAREHLTASEGQTADDVARIALTEAIDAAAATLEVAAPAEAEAGQALIAQAGALRSDLGADLSESDDTAVERLLAESATTVDQTLETAAAMLERATGLRGHVDALAAARQAITDAQEAKAAADAATAAAGAGANTGGNKASTGTSSTGKGSANTNKAPAAKNGSAPSGSTGGGAPSTSGGGNSSGGGGWVEEGSNTWCDSWDTSGAEGTGGWC
jgi:hypothetical protein